MYEFKHKDMKFSKDGSFDEVLALDRYSVSVYEGFNVGDTVVFPSRLEDHGAKQVGEIIEFEDNFLVVLDRKNRKHKVESEVVAKPLETEPAQMWERWAKGGASIENDDIREKIENDMRWLFDGYRYSLGGRIQLMLGQEHVTGKKAPLTAYNCFVIESAQSVKGDKEQFLEVVDKAFYEASIMRRGGGVGTNISHINTVSGASKNKKYTIVLKDGHPDSNEFIERIEKDKFEGVYTSTMSGNLAEENGHIIVMHDSVDGLFKNMKKLINVAYKDDKDIYLDFSNLRGRNAIVKGVNGRSSGAVSWAELFVLIINLLQQDKIDNVDFAEIYSTITNLIEQGGSRRGALMLVNNIDNENIEKFIQRKKTAGFLEGANISVGMNDAFMENVIRYKEGATSDNPSRDKKDNEIWDMLIESAWESAEPGILWLERYNKESNSNYYNTIEATNPCGN